MTFSTLPFTTMPGLPAWLSDVSHKKLRLAACGHDGLRDTINLHRFVLLKNSITHAADTPPPPPETVKPPVADAIDVSEDIFVYPDASLLLLDEPLEDVPSDHHSEEKWLESVLETLDDDFDGEVEVAVHPVDDDDDLEFFDLASLYDSWTPPHDSLIHSPISVTETFLSSPSVLSSQAFPQPPLQLPFSPCDSLFNQPFVEPRYPEADYDLPTSEGSSDSESDDDDDGPLTPYSGSQPSFDERRVMEPEVYVDHDSYFLYPSELDPISPQPVYYQQC